MKSPHIPVLLEQSIEALNIKPEGVYVDGTFGFGGHSQEILKQLGRTGKLIGLEIDKDTYDQAKTLFDGHKNLFLLNCSFVDGLGVTIPSRFSKVDGILLDLGVNTQQIKSGGRGLSFLKNEQLDMRLDKNGPETARDILASYSQVEIEEILSGVDEYRSRQIAKAIVEARRRNPIETTEDLVNIIESVKRRTGKTHPATLTFMALRIAVNDEFNNLKKAIEESIKTLNPNGRLVIISFHSGEDRIVKNAFRDLGKRGIVKVLTKKVIKPERQEIVTNPLSRSAKLRIVEKI